jgi:hypothetical protein
MEPARLEYARPQAPGWRRRLWWITPLALAAAIGTIYLITTWAVPTFERWQDLRRQKRLMEYRAPADQIVFDTNPARAAQLVARSADYTLFPDPGHPPSITGVVHLPPQWRSRPSGIGSMNSSNGLVFLHARTSPGGKQRLVAVECDHRLTLQLSQGKLAPAIRLSAHSVRIGTLRQRASNALSSSTSRLIPNTVDFRLFAGQPDPADASHFTIEYEAARARGTIDGWLNDDDTITLRPRPPIPAPVIWDP